MARTLTVVRDGRTPATGADPQRAVTRTGHLTEFAVPGMHCGGCMRRVEQSLAVLPGVLSVRANLTNRRVSLVTEKKPTSAEVHLAALAEAGFPATLLAEAKPGAEAAQHADLLRCLGVAGFAAANIMLLSVSVWSGYAGEMPASLKDGFHWLSAIIALPAVAYAGRPFFASARGALAAGRLNMDVPISLGVLLATGMSLYQTIRGTEHVYFDAAVTLLFFLLIGRVLDHSMRLRAAGAAENLLGLRSPTTSVRAANGTLERIATADVVPGQSVLVAAGERIPVDGCVVTGVSAVDEALITGESVPRQIKPRDLVHCGTINVSAPLEIEATAVADNTLLADIARMMSAAEQARGLHVRLADRAARLYAPFVHILAAVTFAGWMLLGHGWEAALTAAIAVLIITCPCALALAVPAVQVVATSRLFRHGVVMKSADGLERFADVDTIVFDKTGTLTVGEPRVVGSIDAETLAIAAAIAERSRHPYARAVTLAAQEQGLTLPAVTDVSETPGAGLSGRIAQRDVRLGSAALCGTTADPHWQGIYMRYGDSITSIPMSDTLREDAAAVVRQLAASGYQLEMLSGDRRATVTATARELGITRAAAGVEPAAKIARIEALKAQQRRVLMVGDGLNDAPALAAGHASLSPASAADISQNAADAVFQGKRLAPLIETLAVARAARRRALENFAIAIGYNVVFVPLAAMGVMTPLIAAVAMSASSIAVTANALRLARSRLELKP